MGKKDRRSPQLAFVTLRDMPGTRVMFWVVDTCPYCAERHVHVIGNLRTAEPVDALGEIPAPCQPERTYILSLPPKSKRKGSKDERRKARRDAKRGALDDDTW
ncbi:hypothetical protein LAJ19_09080 [Deinococcus taeanensis]|uniref:hypothetical protein n=1 Tax=Deinococcus taeanensis TaxID=2737050 RepID=UPI001CDD2116|nr:hypothetical protein [Deinococcus taeanensis]UBV41802.1 hypothetical protein LAJ19_09080 [Deinococcus taeanensis]